MSHRLVLSATLMGLVINPVFAAPSAQQCAAAKDAVAKQLLANSSRAPVADGSAPSADLSTRGMGTPDPFEPPRKQQTSNSMMQVLPKTYAATMNFEDHLSALHSESAQQSYINANLPSVLNTAMSELTAQGYVGQIVPGAADGSTYSHIDIYGGSSLFGQALIAAYGQTEAPLAFSPADMTLNSPSDGASAWFSRDTHEVFTGPGFWMTNPDTAASVADLFAHEYGHAYNQWAFDQGNADSMVGSFQIPTSMQNLLGHDSAYAGGFSPDEIFSYEIQSIPVIDSLLSGGVQLQDSDYKNVASALVSMYSLAASTYQDFSQTTTVTVQADTAHANGGVVAAVGNGSYVFIPSVKISDYVSTDSATAKKAHDAVQDVLLAQMATAADAMNRAKDYVDKLVQATPASSKNILDVVVAQTSIKGDMAKRFPNGVKPPEGGKVLMPYMVDALTPKNLGLDLVSTAQALNILMNIKDPTLRQKVADSMAIQAVNNKGCNLPDPNKTPPPPPSNTGGGGGGSYGGGGGGGGLVGPGVQPYTNTCGSSGDDDSSQSSNGGTSSGTTSGSSDNTVVVVVGHKRCQ